MADPNAPPPPYSQPHNPPIPITTTNSPSPSPHHEEGHHHTKDNSDRNDHDDQSAAQENAQQASTQMTLAPDSSSSLSTPPPSFWRLFQKNRPYVLTYCGVFGSFGVCVGFLGPTVFDLGCQTSTDQKEMSWVFFVQLLMTLVGSISAGCLADRAL